MMTSMMMMQIHVLMEQSSVWHFKLVPAAAAKRAMAKTSQMNLCLALKNLLSALKQVLAQLTVAEGTRMMTSMMMKQIHVLMEPSSVWHFKLVPATAAKRTMALLQQQLLVLQLPLQQQQAKNLKNLCLALKNHLSALKQVLAQLTVDKETRMMTSMMIMQIHVLMEQSSVWRFKLVPATAAKRTMAKTSRMSLCLALKNLLSALKQVLAQLTVAEGTGMMTSMMMIQEDGSPVHQERSFASTQAPAPDAAAAAPSSTMTMMSPRNPLSSVAQALSSVWPAHPVFRRTAARAAAKATGGRRTAAMTTTNALLSATAGWHTVWTLMPAWSGTSARRSTTTEWMGKRTRSSFSAVSMK
jgi:predicted dinucleotide-utilizing enzyme